MSEIEILERAIKQGGTFGFVPEFEKAGKTAIKTLEKQIPKKIMRKDGWESCPSCGNCLSGEYGHGKYCDNCGQRLE